MSDPRTIIDKAIEESIALRGSYREHLTEWLIAASRRIAAALESGGKVMIAGNGGSAADSQHFAAELVVRLTSEFDRGGLAAVALTVDSSVLTAAANDYGYSMIFRRQVQALGREGDVFIGLSTSGKSENIINAFEAARECSIATIGLFGEVGLANRSLCELSLCVPGKSTMRIQEEHIFALHLLVELTEGLLFPNARKNIRR